MQDQRQTSSRMTRLARCRRDAAALGLLAAWSLLAAGCASLSSPVANGIPVRMLPDELLAESREGFETIPLTLLRQPPPDRYELAPGDTLGIYVQGVLGDEDSPPPVNIPDSPDLPPSVGYPIPVRKDGKISLPYIGTVKVEKMTVEEAEEKVVKTYTEKGILPKGKRVLVTLMRPRHIRVLIIRDDSQQRQYTLQQESLLGLGTSQTRIGGASQGTGLALELPAYQNDVLNAMARSGGLPGLESTQEIVIQRGYWDQAADPSGLRVVVPHIDDKPEGAERRRLVRIPVRTRGGPLPFTPDDVILQNGDIVTVKSREPAFYYTGGLLPAQELPLPNDYDLTVLEAVLKGRGPLLNGGLNTNNFNGAVIQAGIGNPSPSLISILRKTPNHGQAIIRLDLNVAMRDPRENILVQTGDIILLQESPDDSVARYLGTQLRGTAFLRLFDRQDANAAATLNVP